MVVVDRQAEVAVGKVREVPRRVEEAEAAQAAEVEGLWEEANLAAVGIRSLGRRGRATRSLRDDVFC